MNNRPVQLIDNGPPPGSDLGFENNSNFDLNFTGSTGDYSSCTNYGYYANCESQLGPNGQQWIGLFSNSAWIDVEYDVYSNGVYVGHFGLSFNHQAVTISNQTGVTVSLGTYQAGKPQSVSISSNNPPPPSCGNGNVTTNAQEPKTGIIPGLNQSGFEWGNDVSQIVPPTVCDIDSAATFGFSMIRLPFKLEYGSSDGVSIDQNSSYVQEYMSQVKSALAAGFKVIIDIHNYMLFNGNTITTSQCQTLIGDSFGELLAPLEAEYPGQVFLEVMNEPTSDFSPPALASCDSAAIDGARTQGYNGTILIEGNQWGAAYAWTNSDGTPSELFQTLSPFFNSTLYPNVKLAIHTYWNAQQDGSGQSDCWAYPDQVLTNNRIPELTQLAIENDMEIYITEYGVINSATCLEVLNTTWDYFYANSETYKAIVTWVQTPTNLALWGGNGNLVLVLDEANPDARYEVMEGYMNGTTNGTFSDAFANYEVQELTYQPVDTLPAFEATVEDVTVDAVETQPSIEATATEIAAVDNVEPDAEFEQEVEFSGPKLGDVPNLGQSLAVFLTLGKMVENAASSVIDVWNYFQKPKVEVTQQEKDIYISLKTEINTLLAKARADENTDEQYIWELEDLSDDLDELGDISKLTHVRTDNLLDELEGFELELESIKQGYEIEEEVVVSERLSTAPLRTPGIGTFAPVVPAQEQPLQIAAPQVLAKLA